MGPARLHRLGPIGPIGARLSRAPSIVPSWHHLVTVAIRILRKTGVELYNIGDTGRSGPDCTVGPHRAPIAPLGPDRGPVAPSGPDRAPIAAGPPIAPSGPDCAVGPRSGPVAPLGPDRAPIALSGPDRAPIAPSGPDQGEIALSLVALLYKAASSATPAVRTVRGVPRGFWEGVVLLANIARAY